VTLSLQPTSTCLVIVLSPLPAIRLKTRLKIEDIGLLPTATREVANKALVVSVMLLSTIPERQEKGPKLKKSPTTIGVISLQQAEHGSEVPSQYMRAGSNGTPQNGPSDDTKTSKHSI
jgi:hypothetical protein